MNNFPANDIIDYICSYFTKLDLLMFSKTNKHFNKQSQKHKNREASCKFLLNHDHLKKTILCVNAVYEGHLDILKWLRMDNCRWYSWKYILQRKKHKIFDWDLWTCAYAAKNGHLETLKWARTNGCIWNSYTCAYAAQNGHLETLKWARVNGCDWNSNTCANAAKNGHLEILKWARENGCD